MFARLAKATALLLVCAFLRAAPAGPSREMINLTAEDGGKSRGALWKPEGGGRHAVLLVHTGTDMTQHFLLQPLAEAGFVALGFNNRYAGSGYRIVENMLLDISSAVRYLRENLGAQKVILLGTSGGGSLAALYQRQAETQPPHRYASTAAGDPPDLNRFRLDAADGLVLLATIHDNRENLEQVLDPSLLDEADPFSYDPSVDMYHPDNGYRVPPESSRYSPEFIARYRMAQKERLRRLDALARGYLQEEKFYKSLMEEPGFRERRRDEQEWIIKHAVERPLVIYRTNADLRFTDLSLDPSDRVVGSFFSPNPKERNNSLLQATIVSPRAFLSWRASERNSAVQNVPGIGVPLLILHGTADNDTFRPDVERLLGAAGSREKQLVWIRGADHNLNPSGPQAGEGKQREEATRELLDWLRVTFQKP